MEFRLKPSDPEYEDYNEKLTLLAALKNKHMYAEFRDMPEVEWKAEIARLTDLLLQMSH